MWHTKAHHKEHLYGQSGPSDNCRSDIPSCGCAVPTDDCCRCHCYSMHTHMRSVSNHAVIILSLGMVFNNRRVRTMGRSLYGVAAVTLALFLLATPIAETRSIDGHRHGGMCSSTAASRHITLVEHLFKPDPGMVLEQMSNLHADAGTWLQIGANTLDPVQNANDPFMQYLSKFPAWRKVFVEPIPQLFAKLEQAVQTWPNSTAINVALSTRKDISEESVSMYCLEGATSTNMDGGLPSWANQICSFDPGHVTRHFPGAKAQEVMVKAVSFKHLVSKNNISNVKILLVDTEGFDLHVLEQVPFHKIRPQLVLWEHKHMSIEDRATAWALMRSHCYGVWEVDGENTIALSMTY